MIQIEIPHAQNICAHLIPHSTVSSAGQRPTCTHTHTPSALETFSDGLYNLTLTFYFSLICRQINPDLLLQITSKCTGNIGMWYKNEKDNARNGLATLKGPTAKRR